MLNNGDTVAFEVTDENGNVLADDNTETRPYANVNIEYKFEDGSEIPNAPKAVIPLAVGSYVNWTTAPSLYGYALSRVEGLNQIVSGSGQTVTYYYTYVKATYTISVTDCVAKKGEDTVEYAHYGDVIKVTANTPPAGEVFDKWVITGIDTTGMDLTKTEITFNMPAGNVTFKATYLTIEKFEIYVVDGTKDKSPAKAGETITITANPAPTGKVFDKWTCETAGVKIEFANATGAKTTFVMPAAEIEIKAHFRDIETAPSVEIKVVGGTGGGTYQQGDEVTITAEDKEGKVFKGWKDENGNIVSTDKNYKFEITGARTLTAVYEDKPSGGGEITPPAKKDGLSGGQIAGIVIGTLPLAGIGGFAIFWFAVKKKTFADLIAEIKVLFTKKK